jgi:hypothetical protein
VGDKCTVGVNFKPKYPAPRTGEIFLISTDGVTMAAYAYLTLDASRSVLATFEFFEHHLAKMGHRNLLSP